MSVTKRIGYWSVLFFTYQLTQQRPSTRQQTILKRLTSGAHRKQFPHDCLVRTAGAALKTRSRPVQARRIHAIIPTYKDWDGLRVTLDRLLAMKTPPLRITVVNDNEDRTLPDWHEQYNVEVVACPGNQGPAYARNLGFGFRKSEHFGEIKVKYEEAFGTAEIPLD